MAVRERHGDSVRWQSEKDMDRGSQRKTYSSRWQSEKDMEIALGGSQRKTWR